MRNPGMTRRQLLATAAAAGAAVALPRCKKTAAPVPGAVAPAVTPPVAPAAPARAFKIGACDWSIGKTANVESIEVAWQIGLDGVQVSFGPPGSGADLRDEKVRQQYADACKKYNVEIASLAMGCLNGTPLATDPKAKQWTADCIEVMAKMGQKRVLLAFFGAGDVRDKAKQDSLIAVLKELAPKAEQAGVQLLIESQMNAEQHLYVVNGVGSPAVKVYYDVCNMEGLGYPLYDEIRLLGGKGLLAEVHAKENGFLLGHGKVDFKKVRQALDDVKYEGWLIIEGAVPKGASMEQSYAHNIRLLRSIFPEGAAALSGLAGNPPFKISLAQWSLNRTIAAGTLTTLDFPEYAKREFDIDAVEYVNQLFMDKAKDAAFLAELKKRSDGAGVKNLLIMCDNEGAMGDPDENARKLAVENHFKWVEAAKALGCHSIRVNAHSRGSWNEQVSLAADGLRRLCEFAKGHDINVLVENHGGQSSNHAWMIEVFKKVGLPNIGALPDFGNFGGYDRYRGVEAMMPYAKAVSAKSRNFDGEGLETESDFNRLLQIVIASGYKGYVGIEYEGSGMSEPDGIRATKRLLELVRCGGGRREEKGPETAIISTVDFGDRKEWKVVEVDSQETASENGRAENCLDGNGTSWWHTEWSQKSPKHPHHIIIDTAKSQKITGFRYLPRQSECVNGRIKDYEFFVSDDPKKLGDPVVKGAFPNSGAEQKVKFDKPRQGRYICLKALSEVNGTDWTSVGELGIVTE